MNSTDDLEGTFRAAVRLEATNLNTAFAEVMATAAEAGIPPEEIIGRALARIRQRDAGKTGRLGERIARVRQHKQRIPSLNGTAHFRIPDILTEHELIEVKNVGRLALTPQLVDFLSFSETSGITFVLVTRFDTELAPELQELIDTGRIQHRLFTGLLSENGRRFLRNLIQNRLPEGTA
jgi:hypothetical protein